MDGGAYLSDGRAQSDTRLERKRAGGIYSFILHSEIFAYNNQFDMC